MNKFVCILIATICFKVASSQTTYNFTGNGFWTNASNWSNNTIPPAVLPIGSSINIIPAPGDSCILNTAQAISPGASLNIAPGAIFVVLGGVTVAGILPLVRTDTVFNTASYVYVTSKGKIISNGGSFVTSKGFVWDTLPSPTINLTTKVFAADTLGVFQSLIPNLRTGTKYYIRAFASNSYGTGYGNEIFFTTALADANGDSTFIDPRNGQRYTFRHIGNQVWMTQNLNYLIDSARCYSYNAANCDVYGKLYTWEEALAAVPPGWHIPEDREWQVLIDRFGGNNTAGGPLKATSSLWQTPNQGATNSSHFSSLPGGLYSDGDFFDIGRASYYWTSTETINDSVLYTSLYHAFTTVYTGPVVKTRFHLSVRCIRDDSSFPSLTTDSNTNITDSSVISGGSIISDGGSAIIATGVVWDTVPNPTISLATKTVNTSISNTFHNTIKGLESHKTYYVRAYATNAVGTSYGSNQRFTTLSDSTFTDPRDGQAYTFRRIGSQVWMTQNLNYVTDSGSWCYANNAANCAVYGRLYYWDVANLAVPAGWHLPSYDELQTLANYLGGSFVAGGPLKATAYWTTPNVGATNRSGFTALPGGAGATDNASAYSSMGIAGSWWSSSIEALDMPFYLQIVNSVSRILIQSTSLKTGYSVRCIRDY